MRRPSTFLVGPGLLRSSGSSSLRVVDKYDGLLPEDPAVLEKQFAGIIGKCAADAITSITYGVCALVVRPYSLSSHSSSSSFRRSFSLSLA